MDVQPPIWRRMLVPDYLHLGHLHDAIQCVMGWTDSHLHEFIVGERRYGQPMPEYDMPGDRLFQEKNLKLSEALGRVGDKLVYVYDMGDDWRHKVVVEEIVASDSDRPTARCLAGERCCPPEDCGGAPGYEPLLEVLADPDDEDHDQMVAWAGEGFDPEAIDLKNINVRLTNLAGRWRGPRKQRS